MLKKALRSLLCIVLAFGVISVNSINVIDVHAEESALEEYTLYPIPHSINYDKDSFILSNEMNVVLDEEVDEDTINRLKETLELKNFTMVISNEFKANMTNIFIGVVGSGGAAEDYILNRYNIDTSLFEKTDAYYLKSDNNVISILGRDIDSSFYGLTTLYHVFAQLESLSLRNFTVEDYADVVSRGFIEGYYGNPWSTEDRVKLMEWGGYYKLNSYFYAPKDDPKHNGKWRELYTEEEIETKIRPLAEAGNRSKNRFVFALHPYMSNAIRYNTEENYQADLKVMQAKFKQVIDVGVRQISILADDAGNVGGANYIRTLEDMTAWLKEQQEIYPDLKLTLPFVTQEYMGWGVDYYRDMPDNVQIVMTGGRVWGEVSKNFTDSFTNKVGRGPYMWINWPCTDNSKKHLIMGGFVDFLHTDVTPGAVEGIVLNPMQQSEPSKVAIFGNASYSWNIWETKEEANKAWEDSFAFVDHNNAVPSAASDALKELSKHMINQNMDSRVQVLQESVILKEKLTPLRKKVEAGTLSNDDLAAIESLIQEFELLQEAAVTYRNSTGNPYTRDQIVYWLNSWDDTTEAAIAYLSALKSILAGDVTSTISLNTQAKVAFSRSKSHGFHYVDHTEYAEVGVQHIVPFIKSLESYVSKYVESNIDPNAVIKSFITNRTDSPAGDVNNVFDGNDDSYLSYQNPVWIKTGDYVGVSFNKEIPISNFRFLLGNGKNHIEESKLQYTNDGTTWKDMELVGMNNAFIAVRNSYLEVNITKENLPSDFKAKGIRLIATADNKLDAYLNIHEITINKDVKPEVEAKRITGTVSLDGLSVRSGSLNDLFDENPSSEVMFAKGPYENPNRDSIPVGSSVIVTFDEPKAIGSIKITQGKSAAGDVLKKADLQYQKDGSTEWITISEFDSKVEQEFNFNTIHNVKAIRIINRQEVPVWWRLGEIEIYLGSIDSNPLTYTVIRTPRWTIYSGKESNLYDGDDNSMVWYDPDGPGNSTDDDALVGDFLGYDLGKTAVLKSAHIVVGHSGGDKLKEYAIETSLDNVTWTAVPGYEHYVGANTDKDTLDINTNGISARYIRIKNLKRQDSWIKFSEFTVEEMPNNQDTLNVYTNMKDTIFSDATQEGVVSLQGNTNFSMKKDDYVGIKLDYVYTVLDAKFPSIDGAVIEYAIHPDIWQTYTNNKVDAKYVRLRATKDITLNLNEISVDYNYIADITVSSNFANQNTAGDLRTSKTLANVFDGNLSTAGSITGPQEKGKEIIFDLGQQRKFNSLRYYIDENSLNYPRAADFFVSDALDGIWTKIMHIGPNDDEPISNVWDSTTAKVYEGKYFTHDTRNPGFQYAEVEGLNLTGRYLKIVPTQTYSHRWFGFNEIQINGGEYVSSDAKRDVITNVPDIQNQFPSSIVDGDYSTSYQANVENERVTYRLSEADMRTARIVQNGTISNAKVYARVLTPNLDIKTFELGTLNQAINEFSLGSNLQFMEISIEWSNIIPEIAEIATSSQAASAVNKDALKALIDNPQDTSTWTKSSKDAYDKAYAVGQDVLNNAYVSQDVVNATAASIRTTIDNHKLKGDTTKLQKAVDERLSRNKDDVEIYTGRTFDVYDLAINKASLALVNADDLSLDEISKLEANIDAGIAQLKYSLIERELAEEALLKDSTLGDDSYTKVPYKRYIDAKKALEALLIKDKTGRVNPLEINALNKDYKVTLGKLVDVRALNQLLSESYIKELYTNKTWKVYADAKAAAEALLDDGSEKAIAEAARVLKEAIDGLVDKPNVDLAIKEMESLDESSYTNTSFKVLQDGIEKAKNDMPLDDDDLNQSNIDAMKDARENLVNVFDLRTLINKAESFDEKDFTVDSYKPLEEAVKEVKDYLIDATKNEVEKAVESLQTAIDALDVNAKDLVSYRDSIKLEDASKFTEESYEAYLKAYEDLMDLEAGNTSVKAYQEVRATFEKATKALVEKVEVIPPTKPVEPGDKDPVKPTTPDKKPTTPNTGNNVTSKPGNKVDEEPTIPNDEPEVPVEPEEKDEEEKPTTPDKKDEETPKETSKGGIPPFVYAGIGIAILAIIAVFLKKKD